LQPSQVPHLKQNTNLTQITQELAERIKELTDQIHQKAAR